MNTFADYKYGKNAIKNAISIKRKEIFFFNIFVGEAYSKES